MKLKISDLPDLSPAYTWIVSKSTGLVSLNTSSFTVVLTIIEYKHDHWVVYSRPSKPINAYSKLVLTQEVLKIAAKHRLTI